jgi:hypothetical protein
MLAADFAGPELLGKIENPIIFQWGVAGPEQQSPTKLVVD